MPVGWLQFLIDMSPTGWTLTCMSIKSNDAAPGEGDWQWQEEKDETTGRRRRRVLWESWHTLIGSKWILIFVWFDFTRFDCTECDNEHARSPAGSLEDWRGWLCLHPTAGSCHHVLGLRSVATARRAPLLLRQDYDVFCGSSCLFWTLIRIISARLVAAPNQSYKLSFHLASFRSVSVRYGPVRSKGQTGKAHHSTGRVPTHSHLGKKLLRRQTLWFDKLGAKP